MIKRIVAVVLIVCTCFTLFIIGYSLSKFKFVDLGFQKDCITINIPIVNIINYKPKQSYKYVENYETNSLFYYETILALEITNNQDLLKVYFNAIRCNDKNLAKLLSAEAFPTISGKDFNTRFDNFWNKVAGKTPKFIFQKELQSGIIYVSKFDDKFYQNEIYDYGQNQFKMLKIIVPVERSNQFIFQYLLPTT
jgi:hypothetical protein